MTASSFLVELCCGCCIQRDHEADWRRRRSNHHHRSSRHRSQHEQGGYYKYYSRSERGGEASRHSSHPQAKRAPSSHKIVERQSSPLHRADGRRNSDSSRIKDEHNKTYSTLSSRRRDDASVMGASLCETYQGYLVDDEDDDEYLDEQSAIRRSLKDTRRSRKKPMNDRQKSERQYESEPEPTLSSIKKSKLETYMEEENKRSQSQPRSRRDEAFDNVTTISKASLNPYRVLGLSQGASPREVYDSYKRRQKETHPTASGGSDQAFQNVQNAYRRLRAELKRQESRKERKSSSNGAEKSDSKIKSSRKKSKNRRKDPTSDDEDDNIDKRRQSIDGRLKDHRALVHDLFANDAKESAQKIPSNSSVTSIGHVTTLQEAVYGQSRALMALSLVPIEAGATNINEKKKTIHNNCFYLSLAASYLSGAGAFEKDPTAVYFLNSLGKLRKKSTMTSDSSVASTQTLDMAIASLPSTEKKLTMALALQLKRAIEAAVVLVHPNWASDGMVGEEVQAFSGKCGLFGLLLMYSCLIHSYGHTLCFP